MIKIEDISRWQFPIKLYHAVDPERRPYWMEEKRRCIEGFWNEDFGQWRYMPGKVYFYGNHFIMVDVNEDEKTREEKRPGVWDLVWEMGYDSLESQGFSGFKDDPDKCCFLKFADPNFDKSKLPDKFKERYLKSNGQCKDFVEPGEYIRMLHGNRENPGLPLYDNDSKNMFFMGSRGGGKSYWVAGGELLHEVIFGGAKYYTGPGFGSKIGLCLVGSGDKTKSSLLVQKVRDGMDSLYTNPLVGVVIDGDDITPSPFYMNMKGTIDPNNAENYWRHGYDVFKNGVWKEQGTGSGLVHVNYSAQKKSGSGAQAGAGIRVNIAVVEETGLTANVEDVVKSNEAIIQANGVIFGRQILMGTSENLELVQSSKKIFSNPDMFRIVKVKDTLEGLGYTGRFIPCWLTNGKFKDRNGNTNVEDAQAFYDQRRKDKENDPETLRGEIMNYPKVISDMWMGTRRHVLCYEEARLREKELTTKGHHLELGRAVKLIWDNSNKDQFPEGVRWELDPHATPHRCFPYEPNRKNMRGCVMLYEDPIRINGKIPHDAYIIGYDPNVGDEGEGESIATTYVWTNPKYIALGFSGNTLAATYISKEETPRKYHEIQEKLIQFYGNPPQALWFEANRGAECKSYYVMKGKQYLLCLRPQRSVGDDVFERSETKHGYVTGNKITKQMYASIINTRLLEETEIIGDVRRNIARIPCLYTIQQIMAYDLDGNFDGVDGLRGCFIGLNEMEMKFTEVREKQKQVKMFGQYLNQLGLNGTKDRFQHKKNNPYYSSNYEGPY